MKKLLKIIFFTLILSFIIVRFVVRSIEMKLTFVWMWWNEKVRVPQWREKIILDNSSVWLYKNNSSEKTIIFFHGNGETLNWTWFLHYLEKNFIQYNILAFDYPWYSESRWLPFEQNAYKVSELFYDRVVKEKNIKPQNIVLWWYSLWTALAIDLASKKDFWSLILLSPFTSTYDMTKYHMWFIPQKYIFISNSLESIKKIKNIKNKTLIVHWVQDNTVPYTMWKEIFTISASENKQFITIKWWWHDILLQYANKLLQYYQHFLTTQEIKNKEIIIP